jgi:hypothetical protein
MLLYNIVMLSGFCDSVKRLVQHPTDCSRYIVCDANLMAVRVIQCPGIQLFNEEIGICDNAYYVKCKVDGTTVLSTHAPSNCRFFFL